MRRRTKDRINTAIDIIIGASIGPMLMGTVFLVVNYYLRKYG